MKFTVFLTVFLASSLGWAEADDVVVKRKVISSQVRVSETGQAVQTTRVATKIVIKKRNSNEEWNKACRRFAQESSSTQNCRSIFNELRAQMPSDKVHLFLEHMSRTDKNSQEGLYRGIELMSLLEAGQGQRCQPELGSRANRGLVVCRAGEKITAYYAISFIEIVQMGVLRREDNNLRDVTREGSGTVSLSIRTYNESSVR